MALLKLALSCCLAVCLVSAWCPQGTHLTRHYGGFCYSLVTTELTWDNAHTKCSNSSAVGQLLKLDTESLWHRLRSWISFRTIWTAGYTRDIQEVTPVPTTVSPGASPAAHRWYWVNSTTKPIPSDDAHIGWRNFSAQDEGPCLALAPSGWKAMKCSSLQSLVCQYPCVKYINGNKSTIQSPNYPSFYPANANCEWVIDVGQGEAAIHFKNFRLEGSQSDCSYDYLEIYESKESDRYLAKLCGPMLPTYRIVSPSQHMYIKMVTDGYDQYSGFTAEIRSTWVPTESSIQASHGVLTTPEFPEFYSNNASLAWLIDVGTGSINMRFTDFDIQPGNGSLCTHDSLTVRKDGKDGEIVGTFCGSTVPADIYSASSILHLEFHSDASTALSGFRAIFWSSEETCFNIINGESGVIKTPGYPTRFLGKCVWYINVLEGVAKLNNLDQLNIIRRPFDHPLHVFPHSGSLCSSLRIKISDGRTYSTNVGSMENMCGSFSKNVTSGSQYITIEYVSSYSTLRLLIISSQQPKRLSAAYRSSKNCSYVMRSVTGALTSPEFPSSYDPHSNCSWLIDVLEGNATLLFDDFMFEESDGCSKDRFEIYDGNSTAHRKVGHFCGHDSPGVVVASSQFLFLTMVSDASSGSKGFSAQFWSSDYACTQWGVRGVDSVKINGKCYGLLKSPKIWTAARLYCESYNTSLVKLENEEEFRMLTWWIYNRSEIANTSNVWTAGYRRMTGSNNWMWSVMDGDHLIENWKSGLPWSTGYPDTNNHISISQVGLKTVNLYSSLYPLCEAKSDDKEDMHLEDSCSTPPRIYRGFSVPRGPLFRHNTTVVYRCLRGYEIAGNNNLTCLFGKWENGLPSCRAMSTSSPLTTTAHPRSCLAPPTIPYSSTPGNVSKYPHNWLLHVECHVGFTLEKKQSMVCHDGRWVGSFPYCMANKDPAKTSEQASSSEKSRYSTLVATTVPIIVILLLVIIIIALYQMYTKCRRQPRTNPLLAMRYQEQEDEFTYD